MEITIMDTTDFLTPSQLQKVANKAPGEGAAKAPVRAYKLPCDCPICEKQWRPFDDQTSGSIAFIYNRAMSDAEAANTASAYSRDIYTDLEAVRSVLRSRNELVRTRWLNKTPTKCRTLLKQLRPNMYEGENAYMEQSATDSMASRKHREVFLLPYLTIKGLAKDATRLLRLLHYRVAYAPQEWVSFDNHQFIMTWRDGAIEEVFNHG